ncbi:hypothetical protein BJ166DRAFT_499929 [Pestalotiopsis sp. NC0098]|nr:hypothetical protein BJ166DRAFT_499929 [Pestalotiopsis sp. NC0098]
MPSHSRNPERQARHEQQSRRSGRNERNQQRNQQPQRNQRPELEECSLCYNREVFCDGQRPTCDVCLQMGNECTYVWTRPKNEQPAQRKVFTLDQNGCTNCALRTWVCDNGMPRCQNCADFHGECVYDGGGTSVKRDPYSDLDPEGYMEDQWRDGVAQ